MPRHSIRRLAAASAVAVTTAVLVTGITTAGAATQPVPAVSGTEHIQIMSTTSGNASAIAYGAFTAAGAARLGGAKVGLIVLQGGTIKLSHHAAKTTGNFSPSTCLNSVSQAGSYKILSGTGRYAGIRGHGTFKLSFLFVTRRVHGACSASKAPVAQQELLRLSGPVRL